MSDTPRTDAKVAEYTTGQIGTLQLLNELPEVARTIEHESARRLAIIVELDACKRLKERMENGTSWGEETLAVDAEEYDRRKPLAWAAARAEVEAAQPEGKK